MRNKSTCITPAALLLGAVLALPAHAVGGRMDFNAGHSALLRQDFERAITHFTNAINSADLRAMDLAAAYHNRGVGYLKSGRDDEAIADFSRALELNPGLAIAHNDRAIAFRRKGDFTRAYADYNEAIRLMPTISALYFNRGIAYAADGQYDRAITDFDRALYLKPSSVPAWVARGDAHFQQGRMAEALADYRQAMRRKGDLFEAYPVVAMNLAAMGVLSADGKLVATSGRGGSTAVVSAPAERTASAPNWAVGGGPR